jgi:hypothetical protein
VLPRERVPIFRRQWGRAASPVVQTPGTDVRMAGTDRRDLAGNILRMHSRVCMWRVIAARRGRDGIGEEMPARLACGDEQVERAIPRDTRFSDRAQP